MHKINLFLDGLLLTAFLIIMEPRITGVPWHEWLSIALAAASIIHILLHWRWIIDVGKSFFRKLFHRSRLKWIVDGLLFTAFTITMFTGLLISENLLPALGLRGSRDFLWRSLHQTSANLTLLLVGIHFALNWDWVATMFKRYLFNPIRKRFSPHNKAPLPASSQSVPPISKFS
mgnify:CR=1 FL=1